METFAGLPPSSASQKAHADGGQLGDYCTGPGRMGLKKEGDKRKRHLDQKAARSVRKRPDVNISAIVGHAIYHDCNSCKSSHRQFEHEHGLCSNKLDYKRRLRTTRES